MGNHPPGSSRNRGGESNHNVSQHVSPPPSPTVSSAQLKVTSPVKEDPPVQEVQYSKALTQWLKEKEELRASGKLRKPLTDSYDSYLDLNYDASMYIFSFFDHQSLCRLAAVNKYCYELSCWDEYWLPLFRRCKKGFSVVDREHLSYWKLAFSKSTQYKTFTEALQACAPGQAILVPPGIYTDIVRLNKDDIQLIGIKDAEENLPTFQTMANFNLIQCTGRNIYLKNLNVKYAGPTSCTCVWTTAACSIFLENCILSSGGHSGMSCEGGGDIMLKNCKFLKCPNVGLNVFKGKATLINCELVDCGNHIVICRDSSAMLDGCVFKETENNAIWMWQNSSLMLERCEFSKIFRAIYMKENNTATVKQCVFRHFKWNAVHVNQGGTFTMTDSKVWDSDPRGYSTNGIYGTNSKLITISNCEFRNILMVAVQSNNTDVKLHSNRITNTGEAGITIFGSKKPKLNITDCVISDVDVGVKVGAGAVYEVMERNEIKHCRRQGVYVLRVAEDDDVNLEICRMKNTITLNGEDTLLERVHLQGGQLDVSAEVNLAIQRRECTFRYTGANYHPQMVWRCLSCRLTKESNRGVCYTCKEKCHAGHELQAETQVLNFFCDCGAEKICSIMK